MNNFKKDCNIEENRCNGFHHCLDREFNKDENDCKECEQDVFEAMKDAYESFIG